MRKAMRRQALRSRAYQEKHKMRKAAWGKDKRSKRHAASQQKTRKQKGHDDSSKG